MKKILLCVVIIGFLASCSTSKNLSSVSCDGSSYDRAIIITAKNESDGVHAEYVWLDEHYPGCQHGEQSLNFHNKIAYDILDITTANGTKKSVYFDISGFFGKF